VISSKKSCGVRVRNVEGELDQFEKQKTTIGQRLLTVTSAKQCDALKAEQVSVAEKTEAGEASLLELYEEQEALAQAANAAQEKSDQNERDGARERASIGQELQDGETRLAELGEGRLAIGEKLDANLLGRYERARSKIKGRVVLEVDDMACVGCGMAMSRPHFDNMKDHRDKFYECENCGILLRYAGV